MAYHIKYHRLQLELKAIQQNPTPLYDVYCIDDDITNWHVVLHSKNEDFFLGGDSAKLHMHINFNTGYPKNGPRIQFSHRLPHPNVDLTGKLCMLALQQSAYDSPKYGAWSPAISIHVLLVGIHSSMFDNSYLYCENKISLEDASLQISEHQCEVCQENKLQQATTTCNNKFNETHNTEDGILHMPIVSRITCFDKKKTSAKKILRSFSNDNNCIKQLKASRIEANADMVQAENENYCSGRHCNNMLNFQLKQQQQRQQQQKCKNPTTKKIFCLLDESSSDDDNDEEGEYDDGVETMEKNKNAPYFDPWTILSENEFMLIMLYLNPNDCLTIACTSKAGNTLVKYGIMWREYLKRHLNGPSSYKTNINDWKRCYALSIHNALYHMQCFYTKKSWNQDNNVLGWGITYSVNPKKSKVDYIDSQFDVLSYEAYSQHGVRKSIWNEKFQLFLPLYISKSHFKRGLKIAKGTLINLTKGLTYGNCGCCDGIGLYCLSSIDHPTADKHVSNDSEETGSFKSNTRTGESNWRSKNNRINLSHPQKPEQPKSRSKYRNSCLLKCTGNIKKRQFHPNMILCILPKLMNTFIVKLARSVDDNVNLKFINGYTTAFRIFVAFIEEYPCLQKTIERYLNRFIHEPESRNKRNYESLGELWPLLSVCPAVNLNAFNRAYFEESLARSVIWVFRDAQWLANSKEDEIDQKLLLSTFLKGRHASNTLHMVNLIFITSICRPNLINGNLDIADLISNYDWLGGNVQRKSATVLKQQLSQCIQIGKKSKSWYTYLRFVGINDACNKKETKQLMYQLLLNAIQESIKKKYHSHDTDFSKIHKNGTSRLLRKGDNCGLDTYSNIIVQNSWRYKNADQSYLDASMLFFGFDAKFKYSLDYQHTNAFYGAAVHSGDVMFPNENKGTHKITLDLAKIPCHIYAMYLVISVWSNKKMENIKHPSVTCMDNAHNNQTLATRNAPTFETVRSYISKKRSSKFNRNNNNNLKSIDTPVELCRFELNTDYEKNKDVKNVIMCRIYRKCADSGWVFNAIGVQGNEGDASDYNPIIESIVPILESELAENN